MRKTDLDGTDGGAAPFWQIKWISLLGASESNPAILPARQRLFFGPISTLFS